MHQRGLSTNLFALLLASSLAVGCSSGSKKAKGGVVGFVTGTEQAGQVPTDGTSPEAPTIVGLTVDSSSIGNGQPILVSIAFNDPQGDIASINFGIAGSSTHSVLSADMVGNKTTGTVILELYPSSYVPGTYVLMVSMTDQAGHVSAAATVVFIVSDGLGAAGASGGGGIAGAGGSRASAGGSSGARESILFKLESVQGVASNPPVPTIFTLGSSAYISRVFTYHYAATIGTKSPTVAFKDTTTGTIYGPWFQIGYSTFDGTLGAGKSASGNVVGPPDNYWMAYPAQTVPAGTYQVVDSEPTTWSYTVDLGNRGVAWVYGWADAGGTGGVGGMGGASAATGGRA
ncbi:MAG TPA: hypothetical protein VF518_11445, partial [Polyangia bacterium]